MDKFYLGSSYYPEWWNEEEWEEDFAKMEALGLNSVRMGEFAWSWYEPTEGNYDFEPMKRALDCALKHNIKVVMCTTTAVAPPWLYKKHPEIKGGNIHGRYDYGGRKGLCLSDSTFLAYAEKITEKQTEALGNHPAVTGWQLDNEPGFPFWDLDETCEKGFREWLKEKYGSIDKLNKAWFSMLWSNHYNDFDEICLPINTSEGGWSPEIQLDYRRYFSFTFNRLLSMEAKYVRKNSPGRFIYTNWPGANWSVNCFDGEKYLDYAAWDNYVDQPNGDDYRIQLRASMEHSFDRRLSNGRNEFIVAEQKGFVDADTNPEVIAAQTMLNLSHGAFATFFFEWRMPTGSFEQAYESVLGKDKNFRPETKEVFEKLSADINRIYPLIKNGRTNSQIAMLYSYENSWGMRGWSVDGFYDEEFFNCYGGFKNALGTNVDVVGMQDDLSKYKLTALPNHRITTEEEAEKIKAYVAQGGTVIINAECGTRDKTNQTREMLYPGLFSEISGATVSGRITADTLKKHTGECKLIFTDGTEYEPTNEIYTLEPTTAEAIAVYTSGRLTGKAAITINRYGKGNVILCGTNGNNVYFYEALAKFVNNITNIAPLIKADDGILLSSRQTDDGEYIFAVNMKDRENKIYPEKSYTDIMTGKETGTEYTIKPYGTAVIHENQDIF